MRLEVGKMISDYKVLAFLGAGAMGEVYRARDTRLDRDVAIKALPETWEGDPHQASRFEREAKMLAALNHPNVAQIYGIEETEAARLIVLELVEGEDLAALIGRGQVTVQNALDICRQIAEGLAAAHEIGVVHRDLKPANVRVTPQGMVKILDFGLAKPFRLQSDLEESSLGSTDGFWHSEEGMLIGTPTYMSPEQVRGQHVDRRADIWAFGCVLHECLTRTRTFGGTTIADVLAAVVEREPDMSRLPAATPRPVRELLERCLDKSPRTRLQDIGEARIALDRDFSRAIPAETTHRSRLSKISILVTALLVAAPTFVLTRLLTPAEEPPNRLARATFTKLTDFEGTEFGAAISRDGKFSAFASDRDGPYDVWAGQIGTDIFWNVTRGQKCDWWLKIRDLGFNLDGSRLWLSGGTAGQVRSIPFTGGEAQNFFPKKVVDLAWSPDGKRVVYHTDDDGDPIFVADASRANALEILVAQKGEHQHFPTWSHDGEWVYVVRGRPSTLEMDLWRVRPDGKNPEQLTWAKKDVGFPTPIDARTVLYVAREPSGAGPWLWQLDVETLISRRASIGIEQYTSIAGSKNGRRLLATVANPRARLWTAPVLEGAVATEDDAARVAELATVRGLAPRFGTKGLYFLSSRGTGDGLWCSRDGKTVEILRGAEVALLEPPAISPSGDALAVLLRSGGRVRLHVFSADGAERRPLSDAIEVRGTPSWSADEQWIAIGGQDAEGQGLFVFPLDGGPPRRIVSGEALNPVWSPTEDLIVYGGAQVMALHRLLAVRPSNGLPIPLPSIRVIRLGQRFRFLPDGRGLVYMQGTPAGQDFWLLDLSTHERQRLTQLEDAGAINSFDIAPDGSRIVFDRLRQNSDVVLIELPGDGE